MRVDSKKFIDDSTADDLKDILAYLEFSEPKLSEDLPENHIRRKVEHVRGWMNGL